MFWIGSGATRGRNLPKRYGEDYIDSLRAHRQGERLRVLVESIEDVPAERSRAISRLVLLACEDGFDVPAQHDRASTDPFMVVARFLRGEPNDLDVPLEVPEPWVLRIQEYEFFQHYDEMAEYISRMFFVFTANCLLGREDQNIRLTEPFASKGWIATFIDCSVAAATNFAQRLRSKDPTKYSWIFIQFSELRQPDYREDRAGHGFAVAVRKAIFRLAMDLQALQVGLRSPALDAEDIQVARRMPLFVLQVWMETTVAYRRTWFTAEGLTAAVGIIESHLSSTVDDFGSRAEVCAFAAELAAAHAASSAARDWVRQCWSNLVAYGYHKDMLLDQCLRAAEHLQKGGLRRDALDLLVRLAPAISAVGDYTDGDETNHFPAELGRLLFEDNLHAFVKYHEWLTARGEYWDAGSIFKTFVAKGDLGNRVLRAVAETAVEHENLQALADRSDEGDLNATRCLRELSLFHVPVRGAEPERDTAAETQWLKENGPMPAVDDFPPEKFQGYLEAVQAVGSYRVDENVDAWAKFWSAKGYKGAVLAALEEFDNERPFSYGDSKLRIELTMQVRGKQGVYHALVEAQRKRYGWNRYFVSFRQGCVKG